MNISELQKKAISHGNGPAIVLAGPGSGKTLVITHRIHHLISEHIAQPGEILVITFTRAAALEMKERYMKMIGQSHTDVTFGTFHAVFFQILAGAYGYKGSDILFGAPKADLLRTIASAVCDLSEESDAKLSDLASQISKVKNEQLPLEYYYSTTFPEDDFRKMYRLYQEELTKRRKIDFDDILVLTRRLLKDREDVLAFWQKRWKYILVDEFQDINVLQYDTIRVLAKDKNLFVVGDDDQSIYRFRGSRPEIMLHFEKDYPGCAKLYLTENYRSSDTIVSLAGKVIARNKKRYEKDIQCMRDKGEEIDQQIFADTVSEALGMIHMLRKSLESGQKASEIAILTRTNTGSRFIAQKLSEFQIPFISQERVPLLYDHWIAGDMECFAALAEAIGSGLAMKRADLLRILNKPMRGLPRDIVNASAMTGKMLLCACDGRTYLAQRVEGLLSDLQTLYMMAPFAAVNYIRKGIGYDRYIDEYARYRRIDVEDLNYVLDEFQEDTKGYRSWEEWKKHVIRIKEAQQENRANQKQERDKAEAVTLTTYHGSKGLEFDEVFLPDCNEGMIPWRKALLNADIEEERRLFYVGITRARKKLHVYYVNERYGKKQKISRFLEHIL